MRANGGRGRCIARWGGHGAGGHPSARAACTSVHGLWWWLERVLPGLLPAWMCRAQIPALWGKAGVLRGRFGAGISPPAAPALLPKPVPQKGGETS